MTLRSAAKTLLVLALALPIVQSVLVWVRGMLTSMDDPQGGAIIGRVGTACGVAWLLSVVGLVIVLALVVLSERTPEE
jgi:uncharacterized membrane protein